MSRTSGHHNITCCPRVCYTQCASCAMEFIHFVNLIFIFVVNILFFFSGICLNSLVIINFWRSGQLRTKVCYFMIMVLSCCDMLVVLTNHPFLILVAMLWLTEKITEYPGWLVIIHDLSKTSIGFSLVALFVMNFDRYLATHYPIFHRTSVTKGKLLILFTFAVVIEITLTAMSINDLVISYQVRLLTFLIIFVPPILFINYKLFSVARKSRRNNGISPKMKKSFTLKNISCCLLVIACLMALSIPTFVYIVLRLTSKENENTLDTAELAGLWARTTSSTNSTFNCLIFYWKNKLLRTEGIKVIKSMKICRRVQSCTVHTVQSNNNEIWRKEERCLTLKNERKRKKLHFYYMRRQQTIFMYN